MLSEITPKSNARNQIVKRFLSVYASNDMRNIFSASLKYTFLHLDIVDTNSFGL